MKTAYTSVYKVRKNDTLPIIGKVLEVNWLFIYHLNRPKIGQNPQVIQIGQQLLIPTQIIVDTWNMIMGTNWVSDLSYNWKVESKQLERLIKQSTTTYTEESFLQECQRLKLDLSIGKLLWSLRIKNGMNPWRQISRIVAELIHLGLDNKVYNKQQDNL